MSWVVLGVVRSVAVGVARDEAGSKEEESGIDWDGSKELRRPPRGMRPLLLEAEYESVDESSQTKSHFCQSRNFEHIRLDRRTYWFPSD